MTEPRLSDELDEQATFYALGLLDEGDRKAFLAKLQGESRLRRHTAAYQAVTDALAMVVRPIPPSAMLRERLMGRIERECAREAEQFERTASTVALSAAPLTPRDSVRERLLSRINGPAVVRPEVAGSAQASNETSVLVGGANSTDGERRLSHEGSSFFDWLGSGWTAISRYVRTLLIRSVIPRPSSDGLTFVKASEGTWRGIAPGVTAKLLSFDPVSRRTTTVLRFAAGTSYAPHRHTAVEELYVLEGGCTIGGRAMAVGDYHRAEAGTVHHDTSTDEGCLLLVISSPQNQEL